jgi:hypothetical protein
MSTAIALTIGFCLGAGAAVALLFCVKAAAEAIGLRPKPDRREPEKPAGAGEAPAQLSFEQQLQNLFAFDGKPQKTEGVNSDE